MAAHESKRVVYAALIGNSLIAVSKFAAAAYTGSSAMLSEGIHSLVDTGNQGLMLYGMRRAARPPDVRHPFGHGMELYFWAFVVAILLFAVGGGLSVYEGVAKVREPHPIANVHVTYIVLAAAIAFEAGAWYVAFREFRRRQGKLGVVEAIRLSKDPALFTVLLEDTAAMLGLLAALVGIALGQALGLPVLDGVASIVIGAILIATAAFLAYETKGLLTGEAASRRVLAGIRAIVAEQPGILRVNELLSMHFGPEDVLVTMSLDFEDGLPSERVEEAVSRMERRIKDTFPEVRRVFIEAQGWTAHRRGAQEAAAAVAGHGGAPAAS